MPLMPHRRFVRILFTALLAGFYGSACPGEEQVVEGERPLLLAHYMPWYASPPTDTQWGWHWTMNHFDPNQIRDGRREVASKYYPLIGAYDSSDPHVIEYHLLLMRLAGIDGVIVDWYGLTEFNDYPMLHRNTTLMLQACERMNMKFVICYEDQTVPALEKAERLQPDKRVAHVADEIRWLERHWFQSPVYVRLDDKPVLLSFGSAGLRDNQWTECLGMLEFPVAYFSQSVRRSGAIGGFDWPSPEHGLAQIDRFREESKSWPLAIPGAFPRFVDIYGVADVSESYPDIADAQGETWRSTLDQAIAMKAPIIQLITWNDWGEGTQIEPSVEFGFRDLERLQSVRRRWDPDFPAQATDLRLPLELFQRRSKVAAELLDPTASALLELRLIEARKQLSH